MNGFQDDLIGFADDYALGLMSPAAADLFEAVMAKDPALAEYVAHTRDVMLPLDMSATTVPLPDSFISDLRARIAGTSQDMPPALPAHMLGGDPTVPPTAANFPVAPVRRWMAGIAAALVLGVALGLGWASQRPGPEPVVMAVLLGPDGEPRAVVSDYGDDTAQIRFVADIEVPQGFTLQTWTLPSKQIGPTSLGVLDDQRPRLLRGPDLPMPSDEQLYEITLEPEGGSPTGRPTGPIVAKGFAAAQTDI